MKSSSSIAGCTEQLILQLKRPDFATLQVSVRRTRKNLEYKILYHGNGDIPLIHVKTKNMVIKSCGRSNDQKVRLSPLLLGLDEKYTAHLKEIDHL